MPNDRMQKVVARQCFSQSDDNSLTVLLGALITTASERRDGVSYAPTHPRRVRKGSASTSLNAISPPQILCQNAIRGSAFRFRSNAMKRHLFAAAALSVLMGAGAALAADPSGMWLT